MAVNIGIREMDNSCLQGTGLASIKNPKILFLKIKTDFTVTSGYLSIQPIVTVNLGYIYRG